MGARYVEVNSADFEKFLSDKGFSRSVQNNEIIYIRKHNQNHNLLIKVYTSIRIDSSHARSCGEDAIRVCAVFDNGQRNFGIGKFSRVYRTGSQEAVFERTLDRMRQAYARCNEWNKSHQ